jgi:hypothetical protein
VWYCAQLSNANWEKDWRLRQKYAMAGLGELHTKLKNSGQTLPSGTCAALALLSVCAGNLSALV